MDRSGLEENDRGLEEPIQTESTYRQWVTIVNDIMRKAQSAVLDTPQPRFLETRWKLGCDLDKTDRFEELNLFLDEILLNK
jgi:hypothetical protein